MGILINSKSFISFTDCSRQDASNVLEIVLANRRISEVFGVDEVQQSLVNLLDRIRNYPNCTTMIDVYYPWPVLSNGRNDVKPTYRL